jgi:hypothetical protein
MDIQKEGKLLFLCITRKLFFYLKRFLSSDLTTVKRGINFKLVQNSWYFKFYFELTSQGVKIIQIYLIIPKRDKS